MLKKFLNSLILVIFSLLLIVGCAEQSVPDQPQEVVAQVPAEGNIDVDEMVVAEELEIEEKQEVQEEVQQEVIEKVTSTIKEFKIVAKRWDFEPSVITVNEGDTVKLSIESIDVTHGLFLSAFGINERLKSGEVIDIEFVADKRGTHSFFCSVPCGQGHGRMKGTLIVK